jgi:dTDP-4-amino-4,6-dideoxygalactose transaminase
MSKAYRGFVAPAGTPLGLGDIAQGLAGGWLDAQASERLEAALARRARRSSSRLISSGRAGMTVMLRAMKAAARDSKRTQVIVPAYTCYSVAASVGRAGLELRLCDVETRTVGMDAKLLEQYDWSRVLCVIGTSLYGIPSDLYSLESLATSHGAFFVDDAAQAMGASIAGRPVGGFGSAGLFSFDKGKNITTIQGGVILTGAGALADAIDEEMRALPPPGLGTTLTMGLKVAAYAALLRPTLYGAVRRLPFLGLGLTPFETDYPIARYTKVLSRLAERLHARLDDLNSQRRGNAARLRAALDGMRHVTFIDGLPDAHAVYARFPVLVDAAVRDELLAALEAAGIGASASYPRALADVPEAAAGLPAGDLDTPVARAVASRIVTLPTHPLCPPQLPEVARDVFERVCAGGHANHTR